MIKFNKISEQGQKEVLRFLLAVCFAIVCLLILCGGIDAGIQPTQFNECKSGINYLYYPLLKKSAVPMV